MDGWDGIDEFVAVARTGSFIEGAAALGVSRTHMSRAVAKLEDRLKARLLHRTTRKVTLSVTGRVFLDHCTRLIHERDEALALVREQGEPHGVLRVTCSIALGERFIAPIARRFALQHPQLRLFLDLSNGVVDLIGEGYDLAIRTGELSSSNLIATRIAWRQFHTFATPAYLDRFGSPETVKDLDQHACLVGSSATWHFTDGGEVVMYRPQPVWSCNNGQAVLDAALDHMGISQLPDFYLNEAFDRGLLRPVLKQYFSPAEPIWAVYPDKRHLSPKVRHFVSLLKSELPKALQPRVLSVGCELVST